VWAVAARPGAPRKVTAGPASNLGSMTPKGWVRPVILGAGLCVLPTLAAALLLMVGLASTDLTLVYASIAVTVAAVPAFVCGVVILVRALARQRAARTG
jgi:hypothetical protein